MILGRLVPVIRTFVPVVAGIAQIDYYRYSVFNIVGAPVWAGGILFLGYYTLVNIFYWLY